MEVLYECFSCDYCHRVGTGITIINGFKMCPMCLAEYQHKSGENNKLREELEKQARLIVYQENENAKLKIENAQLKSELEELKKNAVIPEFKKGKWVYVIENNKIYNVKLNKPCIEIIYDYAYNCKKQIDEDGFEDVDYDIGISDGSNLYLTRQEAEEALRKLEEV